MGRCKHAGDPVEAAVRLQHLRGSDRAFPLCQSVFKLSGLGNIAFASVQAATIPDIGI